MYVAVSKEDFLMYVAVSKEDFLICMWLSVRKIFLYVFGCQWGRYLCGCQ